MENYAFHRGVGFTVKEIAAQRWRWTVKPPKSVKGLKQKTGEVIGTRNDAISAAKLEIESQEFQISR